MRFTLGENSIIIVVKLYADLKKELTQEIVMSIAKVLFKEENSTDVLEEIERASSRRLCIDSLLKRVIHGEAATVQSFLMEIKSKCPAMANILAKTIITEEDRKKFQLIDDRVQTNGRNCSRVQTQCRIDEADVQYFQNQLYFSPENVDKIADVLLSKFYMSFSDHSRVTLQSNVFTMIRDLFEKIRSCHLDSVSELESVLGSELYKSWSEFRNGTSGPNGENTGIWQSIIQRICGAAASLMESICQTFHIDFIRTERGSLVLIFKAGDNFNIELLKPESVRKKVRELLEKTCPEHHPLLKDPIHVTIFIKSANYGEKEEIHFVLETIKDRKEIEDGHSHFGRHERDYMIEEMDPTPLKQWMFEKLKIDECTKIHLEDIISWNEIGRGEKMKILIDTLERFEDGYELLQRYCEENDKFVYDKVFQKARQQSITDHATEIGYDKGEGMQKLFSTWIDFSEDPTGIPIEILKMDDRSIQLFEEALKDGKETVHRIRIMVVGHMGVGKTTLVKRLLGEEVNISERHSTEGIDVYVHCCNVSLSTHEWTRRTKDSEQDYKLQRLVKVLNENNQTWGMEVDSELDARSNQRETSDGNPLRQVADDNKNTEVPYLHSQQQNIGRNLSSAANLQNESSSTVVQGSLTQSETNTIPGSELVENVGTENYKMDPLREMLKLLQQNPKKAKQDISKHVHLTIMDFAGHFAFYTTHQMFLTRRAIYLLVSDASQEVDDLVEEDFYFDAEGRLKCKVHDIVQVWMNSIHSCALPDKDNLNSANSHTSSYKVLPPPVILVGTHIDKIPQKRLHMPHKIVSSGGNNPDPRKRRKYDVQAQQDYRRERGQRYLKEIRSHLSNKSTTVHLVDEDFAIDNTILDSKLEELKKKIVEVASQQSYWGEQIPTRWFLLEQQLMRLKDAGVKVVSHSTVEMLNKDGTVRIEDSEELDVFLRYLHDTGTIIYFSIEVLRDNILLDPKWMIDAMKSLINAQPNLPKNPADKNTESISPADNDTESISPAASTAHSDITQKWSDFKEKGILTVELVDAIWTKESHPELHEHKEHILMIMEQLNILAKPQSFNEIGDKVEDYFLAPCMLRQGSPKAVISPEEDPRMVRTPDMCCKFTGKYLPTPIFHRLLAACVARWPVAKKKETSENLIFCGCGVFDLDLFHRLTVYMRNHVIFARITRMVIDEVKTPDTKLCSRVRRFITLNLSKITSYLGQNLRYELQAEFQTWLADEGPDPDAPITREHMNHARLCVVLVTVCGNAMREILSTQVPSPHTDIHQAILANKVKLTSRQGRPLLNSDQVHLVFPDPQGKTTGKVNQFDLALLYILIRNISTVPAPVKGWGYEPQDQPRDNSLGASVERIRSYRNHIIGYSMDGKMSQQDFDDYWNKIDAVLDDIELKLGKQGYRAQLEKQKTQVISIYESC